MYLSSLRTTYLITQEKYNCITNILLSSKKTYEKTQEIRRFNNTYKIISNVKSNVLRRKLKGELMRVATYEQVFDIIHKNHTINLGHPKDRLKNKAVKIRVIRG